MVEAVQQGLSFVFQPSSLIFLVLGVLLGLLFGILPGLGGNTVLALLIPVTYGMDENSAIIIMMGAMGAVAFGGSITAILLNIPGTPPNLCTTFDGFPLAQQGKSGMALGASATSSALGAIFGVAVLAILVPLARQVVMAFSYSEFFLMALMGLVMIAVISQGNMLKGLISGGLGLILAFVGFDGMSGLTRFTFGIDYLWDGVRVVPVMIGMFAIAESMELFLQGGTISQQKLRADYSGVFAGFKAVFQNFPLFLRSSMIGTLVGIVPGVGGVVANFLAYFQAKQTCSNAENFGKGDIRGVIASEASNDAKDGGALVPTIAFGIPGSAEMAILLGALILHGIQPGPRLLIDHLPLIYVLIFSLVMANIMVAVFGLLLSNVLIRLTTISIKLISPLILSLSVLGAYGLSYQYGDVVIAIGFGMFGFFMRKYGYSRISFIIALVLGSLAEMSLQQTLLAMGWTVFFTRPLSLVLLILIGVILVVPIVQFKKREKEASL